MVERFFSLGSSKLDMKVLQSFLKALISTNASSPSQKKTQSPFRSWCPLFCFFFRVQEYPWGQTGGINAGVILLQPDAEMFRQMNSEVGLGLGFTWTPNNLPCLGFPNMISLYKSLNR